MDGLRKILREELINEGYREAKELDALATKIVQYFADVNYPIVNKLSKMEHWNMNDLVLRRDDYRIHEFYDPNKFVILQDFLKTNLTIYFSLSLNSEGVFITSNNSIQIKLRSKPFYNNLKYQLQYVTKDPEDGSISEDESKRVLRTAMGVAFRSVIIHELQHAYDNYVSKGKYTSDKKSEKYYKNKQYDGFTIGSMMSPEERKVYLTLPHEYWARFSETVSQLSIGSKYMNNMQDLVDEFRGRFDGWHLFRDSEQKRLLKAFYKYVDLQGGIAHRSNPYD